MAAKRPPDPTYILRGADAEITSLCYLDTSGKLEDPSNSGIPSNSNQDSVVLLSGTIDGRIHVWNLKTKRIQSTIHAHSEQSVLWMCPLKHNRVITQGRDGMVKIWKIGNEWEEIKFFETGSIGFCKCNFLHCDRQYLAMPTTDQTQVKVIDIDTMETVNTLQSVEDRKTYGMSMCLKLVNYREKILVLIGCENGSIVLCDVQECTQLSCCKFHDEPIMCLDYNPIHNKGVSGTAEKVLHVWTILDNYEISKLKSVEITNAGLNDITIRQDGKLFVSGGWDAQIRIFGLKKCNQLAVLSYHTSSVNCVTFSNDFSLAAGSKDGHISLWDIYK